MYRRALRCSTDVSVFVLCVCGATVSVFCFSMRENACARSLVSIAVLTSADGTQRDVIQGPEAAFLSPWVTVAD